MRIYAHLNTLSLSIYICVCVYNCLYVYVCIFVNTLLAYISTFNCSILFNLYYWKYEKAWLLTYVIYKFMFEYLRIKMCPFYITHTHTDRQTDTYTQTDTHTQTDRQTHKYIYIYIHIHTYIHTYIAKTNITNCVFSICTSMNAYAYT